MVNGPPDVVAWVTVMVLLAKINEIKGITKVKSSNGFQDEEEIRFISTSKPESLRITPRLVVLGFER